MRPVASERASIATANTKVPRKREYRLMEAFLITRRDGSPHHGHPTTGRDSGGDSVGCGRPSGVVPSHIEMAGYPRRAPKFRDLNAGIHGIWAEQRCSRTTLCAGQIARDPQPLGGGRVIRTHAVTRAVRRV